MDGPLRYLPPLSNSVYKGMGVGKDRLYVRMARIRKRQWKLLCSLRCRIWSLRHPLWRMQSVAYDQPIHPMSIHIDVELFPRSTLNKA